MNAPSETLQKLMTWGIHSFFSLTTVILKRIYYQGIQDRAADGIRRKEHKLHYQQHKSKTNRDSESQKESCSDRNSPERDSLAGLDGIQEDTKKTRIVWI